MGGRSSSLTKRDSDRADRAERKGVQALSTELDEARKTIDELKDVITLRVAVDIVPTDADQGNMLRHSPGKDNSSDVVMCSTPVQTDQCFLGQVGLRIGRDDLQLVSAICGGISRDVGETLKGLREVESGIKGESELLWGGKDTLALVKRKMEGVQSELARKEGECTALRDSVERLISDLERRSKEGEEARVEVGVLKAKVSLSMQASKNSFFLYLSAFLRAISHAVIFPSTI